MAAASLWREPAVWSAAIVVIGTQQYALQILHHDGMHRTLLRDRRRNDLLTRFVLSLPLFEVLAPFRRKHLDHHKHLGRTDDPDRYYHRTEGKHTLPRFVFFLCGVQALGGAVRGALRAGRRPDGAVVPGKPAGTSASADWLLVGVAQALIATGLTLLGGPLAYPLLWVLPFAIFVFLVQSVRSFAEHASPAPDAEADRAGRLVTFRSWWLERIVFAPNNMNYHAEHHLYPQVPYYHLPALREHLRDTREWAAVTERRSYLDFVWRYLRALPIDCDPGHEEARAVSAGAERT